MIALTTGNEVGSRYVWRQLFLIEDARVTVIHLEPALLGGWRFQRFDVQEGDAWPDMTAAEIVEWKTVAAQTVPHELVSPEQTARAIDWLREQGWSPKAVPLPKAVHR